LLHRDRQTERDRERERERERATHIGQHQNYKYYIIPGSRSLLSESDAHTGFTPPPTTASVCWREAARAAAAVVVVLVAETSMGRSVATTYGD
jgi:hypothetical protein